MNVFTNEAFYAEKVAAAKRLQRLGMAALAVMFIVNCPILLGAPLPWWVVIAAYPFLIIGWPVFTIGSSRLRRLRDTPRPDGLINEQLKGLNNKYSLYHFVPREANTIPHLLVAPGGLVVMESRDVLGDVKCKSGPDGDKWSAPQGLLERLGSRNAAIGNPTRDLDRDIVQAKALLAEIGKPNVPVKGLVVFTRLKDVEIESCAYSVVPLDETKGAVRSLLNLQDSDREESGVHAMLTSDDRRRINSLLAPSMTQATPAPAAKSAVKGTTAKAGTSQGKTEVARRPAQK